MLSKSLRIGKLIENLRKIALGIALSILIASKVLSGYSTVKQVNASFTPKIQRTEIKTPYLEDSEALIGDHVESQKTLTETNMEIMDDTESVKERADRIRSFYARWNSPMADSAEYIVKVADKFGIDWRLIPAISVVESSGGNYCFRPYNAFGWGQINFSSFEESIYTVTKGLAEGYGTDNPFLIAPTYNPVTPESWGTKVNMLMNQI